VSEAISTGQLKLRRPVTLKLIEPWPPNDVVVEKALAT
jgi:hypothetical protein